ncbi:hypothetical protein AAL_07756 [Moelleriella libera RCEF 2490]|uniref:Uncharacterized protein n=1 Tax=Moelleriella libera RCEF 2490 TaxID=1081109 RepID=A0A167WZJ1_9HYPO|nr:hypothetical protein AAL_07756 [Moelleriella libera RCEF 2490]
MRDAAIDLVDPSKRQSVDSVLMTAVSRSIAQQFRLLSTLQHQTQRPPKSKSTFANNGSSGSSQKRRLNHYTKDLEAFAERVAARGKVVRDSPSPPADAATLRTVTELFPYRPQLRAAGLAVTSKEQAKSVPKYLENWQRGRPKTKQDGWRRRKLADAHAVQVDGHGSAGLSQSTGTEISFARPQNTDAVRLALIDEAPIRKKRRSERKKGKRRRCLPCFSARDDLSTDNDWAHFRAPSGKAVTGGQEKPSFLKGADRSARLPRPSECYTYSPSQSPRYMSGSKTAAGGDDETYSLGWDRPNFITTGRRFSMTAPRTATQSDARTARRQQTLGEESAREASQLPPSAIFHGEDSPRYHSVVSHHPTARPSVAHNVSSARRHKDYADAMRSSQTGQQQHPSKTSVLRPVPPPRLGPNHVGICCPQSRDVPAKLTARPNIPRRTSSMKGSISSIDLDYDDGEIQDRDVLRGLHMAASAACNEEVDAFVRNRTGLRIRRFLADLMALETLTAARPGEDDAQHARRRRAEMRKLKKQVRRSREVALSGGLF